MLRNGVLALSLLIFAGCSVDSISKAQIEAVQPGTKITYRYLNEGKVWYYTDRVTRVEGDVVFYNPSLKESSSGKDSRLDEFDETRELSVRMADLVKYENPRPPDATTIIRIE
jgi:hypothetical protein